MSGVPSDLTSDLSNISVFSTDRPTAPTFVDIQDTAGNRLAGYSTSCFLNGTLILTADGEMPIDTIEVGDEILTYDAGYVPAVWIGQSRRLARFSQPHRIQPVRFAPGSLGDGTPHAPLYVSPDHSMLIEGHFVHAALLVGCDGIDQNSRLDDILYYHLDLGAHHAVLAEGAWTESYAEQFNRRSFDNAATWPGAPRFVPLSRPQAVEGHPILDHVRARLGWRRRQAA